MHCTSKFTKTGLASCLALGLMLSACQREMSDTGTPTNNNSNTSSINTNTPVFMLIDEDAIDNGNPPNNFSANDVNDQLARVGLRQPLEFFLQNEGKTIDLYTGEVGDEAFFAIRTIPNTWKSAGPGSLGAGNFLAAGPGLGSGTNGGDDNKEVLLDKIPDITPLRATGLSMLVGTTLLAVVFDGDISINYSPMNGNLQGANLGIVALDVISIRQRTDGSTGSLPRLTVRIRNASAYAASSLRLFANAPVPSSSSEPYDIAPTSNPAAISLETAQ